MELKDNTWRANLYTIRNALQISLTVNGTCTYNIKYLCIKIAAIWN
jgi:hypothetical protein